MCLFLQSCAPQGRTWHCVTLNSEHRDAWAMARPEMMVTNTGWSGLHGRIWKEAAEGRKKGFLMPHLQPSADSYIINKI